MTASNRIRYHIYGRHRAGAQPDRYWYDSARGSERCIECGRLLAFEQVPDVPLKELPKIAPINVICGIGAAVVQRSFMEELGLENVSPFLQFGRVLDKNGTVNSEFMVMRGRYRVYYRGTEGSTYRGLCPGCGEPRYHAYGYVKDQYLLRNRLPPVPIMESQISGLVITSEIMKRVSQRRKRELHIDILPIIDTPRDGLGELPF